MSSHAFSYVIIHLKFSEYLETTFEHNPFFSFRPGNPWHPIASDSLHVASYSAFFHNVRAIVHLASLSNIRVMLVPEVIDSTFMQTPFDSVVPLSLRLHTKFLDQIALSAPNGIFCKVDTERFIKDGFERNNDGLHVDARGEELKAEMMEAIIVGLIQEKN